MARTLKLFARRVARLIILGAPSPKGTVETEDGRIVALDNVAIETVRRIIGRKDRGILSPLDGAEAQSLLGAVERRCYVGEIFQITLRGTSILFVIEDDGLAFLSWSSR